MCRATLIGVIFMVATSGCSKLVPRLDEVVSDNRKQYQKAETLPDLEVPPDLSTEAIRDRMAIPEGGEAARFSTFQERRAARQKSEEIEQSQSSAIRVLENEHVLAVDGAAVQVWPKLREFWQAQGYALELDDVELGVIETAWNEGADELSRDKFKIFAEAGEKPGTTVLYVSHEAQELVPQGEELVWQRRAREGDQERSMAERLQEFMSGAPVTRTAQAADGASTAVVADTDAGAADPTDELDEVVGAPLAPAATADDASAPVIGADAPATGGPQHAELVSVGGGKLYLTLAEDFPSAWKTTGRALERAGVQVKDSDKGRGVYLVELAAAAGAEAESGVLGKLKFWDRGKGTEFQVSLTGVGDKTEVVVLDRDGRWETGDQAGTLLNKLQDALNSGHI